MIHRRFRKVVAWKGGQKIEREEAGRETSDREGGIQRCGEKVGQRLRNKKQRCREMDREK